MTKRQFLRRLGVALWGSYRRGERRDILADFEGFFAQEHSGGFSDARIATNLGDPVTVALNLAREEQKPAPFGALVLKHAARMALFVGCMMAFGAWLMFHGVRSDLFGDMTLAVGGVACFVVMIMALSMALKPKMAIADFRGGRNGLIAANIALLTLALGSIIFFSSNACVDLAFWMLENARTGLLTNGVSEIRAVVVWIAAGIGCWAIYGVWRGKAERLITAIHAVGLCVYLEAVRKLWTSLGDIQRYRSEMAAIGWVYGVAVIVTVASAVAIHQFGKGAVNHAG